MTTDPTMHTNDGDHNPLPRSVARGTLASIPGWPEIECHVLADEATGYQTRRAPDALSRLFADYLLPEPGEWSRAIPEDLYVNLARLYRHAYTAGQARRPLFFRSWTWQFVYGFLPGDVRSELQRRNPAPHAGSTKHHQHLTPRAREVLAAHLIRLTTVVRQSGSVDDFHMRFGAEFRGGPLQLSFPARAN